MSDTFRSGFVGLVGRYNTGKSTLLNTLLKQKLAITSPQPQTTRQRILGILHRQDAQIALLDSPGSHDPKHALGRMMLEALKSVVADADVLIVMVDATQGIRAEDNRVFARVKESAKPAILALNKVDLVGKEQLLPIIDQCAKTGIFKQIVPISAKTEEQLEELIVQVVALLPEGPELFEKDRVTDQSEMTRIRELIREPILWATKEEVPHSIGVLIDLIETAEESERKRFTIHASILVERPGQRAILLGHKGKCIKHIGMQSRKEIEKLLGERIYLNLWVKVAPDWRRDPNVLRELGYT